MIAVKGCGSGVAPLASRSSSFSPLAAGSSPCWRAGLYRLVVGGVHDRWVTRKRRLVPSGQSRRAAVADGCARRRGWCGIRRCAAGRRPFPDNADPPPFKITESVHLLCTFAPILHGELTLSAILNRVLADDVTGCARPRPSHPTVSILVAFGNPPGHLAVITEVRAARDHRFGAVSRAERG